MSRRSTLAKANEAGLSYYEYVVSPTSDDYMPNEREQLWLYAYVELGMSVVEASDYAGYKDIDGKYTFKRAQKLAPQIQKLVQSRLRTGAPLALSVLEKIMKEKKTPPATKLKAATEWLDRSGYSKQVDFTFEDKSKKIEDFSPDELRDAIFRKAKRVGMVNDRVELSFENKTDRDVEDIEGASEGDVEEVSES